MGILSIYYGYTTTKTDSIDTKLYQHLNNRPHPRCAVHENGEEDGEAKMKYCWVCQTNVYETSMHCKYCDKCVSTFDHHCMWLNNCIGDANYGYFFNTVWFTCMFIATHAVSIVVYLALYFVEHQKTRELSNNWMGANVPIVVVGFNIGFLVLTGFAALLVVQLLWFHLSLKRQNITTYQFIIRDTQQKREHWNVKQKVNQKRQEEVTKAKDAGKCMNACWIGLGAKYCKTCDPIILLVREEVDAEVAGNDDNDDSSNENLAEDEKKSEKDSGGAPS